MTWSLWLEERVSSDTSLEVCAGVKSWKIASTYFIIYEEKNLKLDGQGDGDDLGEVGGGEKL